jgi:WD40 repeat protein
VSRFGGFYHSNLVKVWETETGKELWKAENEGETPHSALLAFTADSKTLLHIDNHARKGTFFEATTGKEIRELGGQAPDGFWSAGFSSDGKLLATREVSWASGRLSIRLWDPATGKEKGTPLGESASTQGSRGYLFDVFSPSCAFAPDGKTLAATQGHAVRLWDVASGKEVTRVVGQHTRICSLGFSADGRTLTTAGEDGAVQLWDVSTSKVLARVPAAKPTSLAGTSVAPDGRFAARLEQGEGAVRLWDLPAGKEARSLTVTADHADCFAFSPDGKYLAMKGRGAQAEEGPIYLWETATGKELAQLPESIERGGLFHVTCLALSADNAFLACARNTLRPLGQDVGARQVVKCALSLWSIGARRQLSQWELPRHIVELVLSPTGRTMAVVYQDNSIGVWELATQKERYRMAAENVRCVKFSPGGRTLAVGCFDHNVRLYDAFSGKELRRLEGHQGYVEALAFSADGKALASGASDTTALVWDLAVSAAPAPAADLTQQELAALRTDLSETDAAKGLKAMQRLAGARQTVAWLREQLKPAPGVEARRLEQLIGELGSNDFAVRQKAHEELEKLGELAGPALRKAIAAKPSLDVQQRIDSLLAKLGQVELTTPQLQAIRAVEVLEHIGTPEAVQLLTALAKGAPGARLTREAEAALQRLKNHR